MYQRNRETQLTEKEALQVREEEDSGDIIVVETREKSLGI